MLQLKELCTCYFYRNIHESCHKVKKQNGFLTHTSKTRKTGLKIPNEQRKKFKET